MVKENKELDGLIDEQYVPSSVERKKAVLMYFFIGIIAALSKQEVSVYEMFHLKQAMGRRMMFFIFLIIGIVFVFIPYIRIVPVLVFIACMVVRLIFVKQAREGRYVIDGNKILMPLYAGLGGWMTTIFELETVGEE